MPTLPHPRFIEKSEAQAKQARKSHSKNIWAWHTLAALYGKHSIMYTFMSNFFVFKLKIQLEI